METTLNMHLDILDTITQTAKIHSMSRTKLITDLIKKVLDETEYQNNVGKSVQYQDRRGRGEWHKFHIRLNGDDYEYLLDLKKILKMSASLIIAYAVKKFLIFIIYKKSSDNYLFQNYFISLDIVNGVKIWKIYWGIPPG